MASDRDILPAWLVDSYGFIPSRSLH
jgi:aminopeptidase N